MSLVSFRAIRSLTISRDDHIGDPIGAIFLEPDDGAQGILNRINEYLGGKAKIITFDLAHDKVRVEVEPSPFCEESTRLACAAADLSRKGAPRNAMAMFKQALELDPFNGRALYHLGLLMLDRKEYRQGLSFLRRAREIEGDSVDLLRSMAGACVQLERVPAAVGYLERALDLEPGNRIIRRELLALGRKPPPRPVPIKGSAAARRRSGH